MKTTSIYKSPASEKLALGLYQRTLDAWPVPSEQRGIPTRLGETFVISFGDPANPPLILLHGSAANSSTWAGEARAWSEHFRVHAVDLPGETGKSTQVRPPYEGAAYAEWLTGVLDALGIQKATFAGLSLGGWAALKFAATVPGRSERIVLIAPGGVVQAKAGFILKAAVYQKLGRWGIRRITRIIFAPNAPPPGVEEGFAFMLRHYRARRDNLPPLSDEELRRVTVPVFLIGGEKDALINMQGTHDRLAKLLPVFEARIIPGAGHGLLQTASEAVGFLRRQSSKTPAPQPAPAS